MYTHNIIVYWANLHLLPRFIIKPSLVGQKKAKRGAARPMSPEFDDYSKYNLKKNSQGHRGAMAGLRVATNMCDKLVR